MPDPLYLKDGSVLVDGEFRDADILVLDGIIARILPRPVGGDISDPASGAAASGTTAFGTAAAVLDLGGMRVLPGFIDIHTHGGAGVDFNHATAREAFRVAGFFASCGVTAFLPTILADSPETMARQLEVLTNPDLLGSCPQVLGIHLEGPFLSARYRGAQPEEYLHNPDLGLFEKFQKAARGKILLTTISPELEGATAFTTALTASGVRVAIGHSAASYEEAMAAIAAGAVSATHVMNAMKLLHMHDPAILTAVLESGIYAEMICDGIHLHPAIVRLLLKVKGLDRMIAVTDSIMAAGLPDGNYILGTNDVVVSGGDAKVASTGARAGSTLPMDRAVRNIGEYTGLGLEKISRLVSENPARMLGVFGRTGSIAEGKAADLVVLDDGGFVAATIASGALVYRRP